MPSQANASSPLTIRQSTLIAAAGEYYILARLSLLGKIAAQAPRGVPNADIVVSSVAGDRLCAVQVKARQGKGADRGWHMGAKHEGLISPNLFYAFVDFVSVTKPTPITYLVPSEVVASALKQMHQAWLKQPGQKGQKHNDSDFRRFMPDYSRTSGDDVAGYSDGWLDPYHEAWHLLP
jgi:hypothetical protein